MSLSSALFSGISGLNTLGNAMTVIGDNIANVNTVGFKGSRTTFQDVLSQTVATAGGTAQVGRGTSLADITRSFSQGSFESTDFTTDLAIGGEGFFVVRDPSSQENEFYTRSGEFRFDKDGNFTNPAGYIVRGWYLDPDTGEDQGSITDIVLQSFTSSPKKTDRITMITNLDSDVNSKAVSISNAWDGTATTPLATTAYEYQSTLKAYDALGSTRDVTIYYDKISGQDWEYIVTCNPSEDKRSGFAGTTSAGLLARGEITFSTGSGTISDLTLETLDATGHQQTITNEVYGDTNGITAGNTTITINNFKALNQTFPGAGDDFQLTWSGAAWSITTPAGYGSATVAGNADGATINLDGAGSPATDITVTFASSLTGADTLQFDILGSPNWTVDTANTNGYFEFSPDFLGGASTSMDIELDLGVHYDGVSTFIPDSLTTTQFSSSSTTTFQSANGYGAGDLQSVMVATDGAIIGQYSNGQVIPLYRVALVKFQNNQGLFKIGGNLFRMTTDSGEPISGKPGTAGLGSLSPNSLEQSNVDIATEFVKMITTQRGFQANSKIITVTDQMLAELIALKR